jgi:hypothetical protein
MTIVRRRTHPASARRLAAAAVVAGVSALASTLTAPMAHADDALIRSAVDGVRTASTCPAMIYRDDLAGAAYAYARGGSLPSTNGYPGTVRGFKGTGDPAAEATGRAISVSRDAIKDCKYTDFGVSLHRNELTEIDLVAIVLGVPTPKPFPMFDPGSLMGGVDQPQDRKVELPQPELTCGAACQAPPQTATGPTATVTSDVDVYDKPGGNGNVIGMLRQGDVVKVATPCAADDWCALADGRFAYGEFFKND